MDITINNLSKYRENNRIEAKKAKDTVENFDIVALWYVDGLITFTQPETSVYDDEHDEVEVNDIKHAIEHS